MSTECALLMLAVTLCVSCVAVVYLACRIVLSYQKQLSAAAELAIREPYRVNPNQYMVLAHADKVASGRASSNEVVPAISEQHTPSQPTRQDDMPLSNGVVGPYEEE
jgi:hypothetical protein